MILKHSQKNHLWSLVIYIATCVTNKGILKHCCKVALIFTDVYIYIQSYIYMLIMASCADPVCYCSCGWMFP